MTGPVFRSLRLQLGLSQRELGEIFEMTDAAICMLESGKNPIRPRTALAIECLVLRRRFEQLSRKAAA